MYWAGGLSSKAAKLTVVVPSTAGAKLKWLARYRRGSEVIALLRFRKGRKAVVRWLHQVFMSTGVKKMPRPRADDAVTGQILRNAKPGGELKFVPLVSPSG